jgi:Ca2+-binding EF-hand superfamily protein
LKIAADEATLKRAMAVLDVDKNGYLDFKDFQERFTPTMSDKLKTMSQLEKLGSFPSLPTHVEKIQHTMEMV